MRYGACYIRVSTDDQTEYSPDSQLKLLQEYAEKNDIVLLEDHIYMEDGGKSGKSMAKRDKFLEMIAVSKKKPAPFNVILVWKFSRFARNQQESIVLKSLLKKNDIEVISISEPLPEGPFGELIERILEWQDEFYLTNLSQEVKRGMTERASRGLPVCPAPIGYDTVDGMYVPNDDAEFVRGIFDDYLSGMGLRALAVKYGNLGLRTTRGNLIDNRAIEYMLRNPVYVGKIRWSVEGRAASTRHYNNPNIMVVDGKHQPIVSTEVFEQAQKKLDEQKRMYGRYQRREQPINYMLKGLVRCSSCGSTLILVNTKSPALQCHSYNRGQCKVSHSMTVAKANASIINYLENVVLTGEFNMISLVGVDKTTNTQVDYIKLIDNEKTKLKRIKLAYQAGIDTLEEYKENKSRILANISRLEKIATVETPQIDQKEYCNRILSVLKILKDETVGEDTKNAALRTIIHKIVFNKAANDFEVYFY